MPRSLRIQYPGAYYHVMARGNRREDIFHDDDDRRFFLKALGEACEMTGWRVHGGYALPPHKRAKWLAAEAGLRTFKLAAAGLNAAELAKLKGSDPRKVALARLLWRKTVASQEWIATALKMRSAVNVSQQLRRQAGRKGGLKLPGGLETYLRTHESL